MSRSAQSQLLQTKTLKTVLGRGYKSGKILRDLLFFAGKIYSQRTRRDIRATLTLQPRHKRLKILQQAETKDSLGSVMLSCFQAIMKKFIELLGKLIFVAVDSLHMLLL